MAASGTLEERCRRRPIADEGLLSAPAPFEAAPPNAGRRRSAVRAAADVLAEGGGLLAAAPLWLWWAIAGGGYAPTVWIPGLLYLAAAAAVLAAYGRRRPLSWRTGAPLAALAVLFLLTATSLVWTADRGAAWIAGERMGLMLAAFALPLVWPPSLRGLRAGVIVFVAAALVGFVAGVGAAFEGGDALVEGRLSAPTDYVNATAALLGVGGLTALVLAAVPRERISACAVLVAAGGTLVAGSLLAQSRGGLAGVIITAAIALLIAPARITLALTLLTVAAGAALVSGPVFDVRTAARAGDAAPALSDALLALAALALGAGLIGGLLIALTRRVRLPDRLGRTLRRGRIALGAVGVMAAVATLVVAGGDLTSWTQDRFEEFKTSDSGGLEPGESRLGRGLGTNRYDYWRVAVEIASDDPWTGVGGGNFAAAYLARRGSNEEGVHAHGVWFEYLAELGMPGLLALAAFAVAFAVAFTGCCRRSGRGSPDRALRVAAVIPLLYLFVHGSGDWLWPFPALTVPALGLSAAAIAIRTQGEDAGELAAHVRSPLRWAPAALVLIVAMAATPVFLSARLTERAISRWHDDPATALADLDTARRLDPLSASPALVAGIIAVQSESPAEARRAFAEAMERNPRDWFPRFELGLLAAVAGNEEDALERLAEARERNPRETLIELAQRRVERGRPPDPAEATVIVLRAYGSPR